MTTATVVGGALLWAAVGFVLGSIPFGLLVLRLVGGPDPRTVGSGNIGATNVVRAGGKALGLVTLVLDAAKGLAPVLLAGPGPWAASAGGAAAVLGHCFSPWLRLRGGKGVATFLGVCVLGGPWAPVAFLVAWFAGFSVSRVSAIASVVATVVGAGTAVIRAATAPGPEAWAGAVALCVSAVVVVVRHRSNFEKLRAERQDRAAGEAMP